MGNFSGIAGAVLASTRTALAVWAKNVNARGGIACRPVVLYSQDDDADHVHELQPQVQDLVQNEGVVALVGRFTILSVTGFRSAVEAARVPVIGGDVLTADWNCSPHLFPQGAGIRSQLRGILCLAVAQGHRRFGELYCEGTSARRRPTVGHRPYREPRVAAVGLDAAGKARGGDALSYGRGDLFAGGVTWLPRKRVLVLIGSVTAGADCPAGIRCVNPNEDAGVVFLRVGADGALRPAGQLERHVEGATADVLDLGDRLAAIGDRLTLLDARTLHPTGTVDLPFRE